MDIGNLLHTIVDYPGIGGIIFMCVYGLALIIFVILTRWILAGGEES